MIGISAQMSKPVLVLHEERRSDNNRRLLESLTDDLKEMR